MADLNVYHEYGEELERRLRLKTFPLALKLLEKERDVPNGAQRPVRDFATTCHYARLIRFHAVRALQWQCRKETTGALNRLLVMGLEKPQSISLRDIIASRRM